MVKLIVGILGLNAIPAISIRGKIIELFMSLQCLLNQGLSLKKELIKDVTEDQETRNQILRIYSGI